MGNVFKRLFYNIAGLPLIHCLGRPWRGRACVLCYHRVLPDEEFFADQSPNSNLIMPTSKFAEQMKFLSERHTIVSMDFATSVIPGWHTTIFTPYFVAGAIFSGFAMVLTLLIISRKGPISLAIMIKESLRLVSLHQVRRFRWH